MSELSANPAITQRADFSELLILLKAAPSATFLFALYNTAGTREEVTASISQMIAPVPVHTWTYRPDDPYPVSYLTSLTEAQRNERAVVFFFDLERGDANAWKSLDHNREHFAERPHTLIFWVTQAGRLAAAKHAPHFWAQRSLVFDFTVEQEQALGELRGEWAGRNLYLDNHDDALRQLRVFQGLLDEYTAQPDPPARPLADLNGKVAWLLAYLGRREEALPFLQSQLALARELTDRDLQAEALTNLAQVERIRTGKPAAIPLLEEALSLAEKPQRRAETLKNLAAVIYSMGEAERAMSLLEEALNLQKLVGDNLGQANVLKAIGDVQSFRDEKDDALRSYDDALRLFKLVGDNLGQANVLQAIGDVQSFRKEMDDALRSYDDALRLFKLVGDNLGQANVLLSRGQLVKDLSAMEQALALYEKIGDGYSTARCQFYIALMLKEKGEAERVRPLLLAARERWSAIHFDAGVAMIDEELA